MEYSSEYHAVVSSIDNISSIRRLKTDYVAFTSFNDALFVKLSLLNRLREDYIAKLKTLADSIDETCPDVSTELNELKATMLKHLI
jgi:hypothetical protein